MWQSSSALPPQWRSFASASCSVPTSWISALPSSSGSALLVTRSTAVDRGLSILATASGSLPHSWRRFHSNQGHVQRGRRTDVASTTSQPTPAPGSRRCCFFLAATDAVQWFSGEYPAEINTHNSLLSLLRYEDQGHQKRRFRRLHREESFQVVRARPVSATVRSNKRLYSLH